MTICWVRGGVAGLVFAALAACGGGSDNDDRGGFGGNPQGDYRPGVFLPSSSFENKCAAPVPPGNDTESGVRYAAGSVSDENNFLRSWSNELYLWYRELPDLNPYQYHDPEQYFDLLKTGATTSSGRPKDNFHFTYGTPEWRELSQSGTSAGYGAQWVLLSNPRSVVVAYTEPNSPASAAGLQRGDVIITVDGLDVATSSNTNGLNAGLFPSATGQAHTFTVRRGSTTINVSMTSATVTSDPVQNVSVVTASNNARVGYILFNDHILTAERELRDAVATLSAQNITELVLDVRYNGGGYLALASELSYMIAGSARTGGRVFERLMFNDKHTATNPVTGQALQPTPFYSTANLDTSIRGQALPTLNLQRVFVLTSSDTCSASESIINGLRGVGMDVIQIGSRTCGKPYGFYPEDNCGITYFTIQFKGVNDANFGDYADGFTPSATPSTTDASQVRGCPVADDFTQALGSTAENRFETALHYITTGSCPSTPLASDDPAKSGRFDLSSVDDGYAPKILPLTNRILPRE